MRRRYGDCQRADGNCAACSLSSYGRDCRGRPIAPLSWYRMAAELTQAELADKSGVYIRTIQKIESGEAASENLSAKNLLALADVLGVDPHDLL